MRCKNMNLSMVSIIAIFILLFGIGVPLVFAVESSSLEGSGVGIVDEAVRTRALGPAEQKFIDAAVEYVKQKLGKDYYNQFISFQSGESYEDCKQNGCSVRNEISFDYDIPFEIASDPHLGGVPAVRVTLDEDGDIVRYAGPVKPYKFLISKEEAINLAKSYGLVNITEAGLATSSLDDDGYEMVWAVSSNEMVERASDESNYKIFYVEPIYKGVYVDVDTGEIRGEYSINPLIQTPGAFGGSGANLGEFFDEQGRQIEQVPYQIPQKIINWGIAVIVIIVALIVFLFVRYSVHRK